jgi:hypothetical protein
MEWIQDHISERDTFSHLPYFTLALYKQCGCFVEDIIHLLDNLL